MTRGSKVTIVRICPRLIDLPPSKLRGRRSSSPSISIRRDARTRACWESTAGGSGRNQRAKHGDPTRSGATCKARKPSSPSPGRLRPRQHRLVQPTQGCGTLPPAAAVGQDKASPQPSVRARACSASERLRGGGGGRSVKRELGRTDCRRRAEVGRNVLRLERSSARSSRTAEYT